MQDLVVLELIISTVLFLAVARPFVKSFRGVDGIAALPAIALVASIAVYPAYGFRPEFLPLFALSFLMFLGSIPRLVDVFRRLRTDDYGERSLGRLALGILVLTTVTVFAVVFAPKTDRPVDGESNRWLGTIVHDDTRDVDLSLRYYPGSRSAGNENERRPIILIAPPLSGSFDVTDNLCVALSNRGFLVAVFSRVGLDFPTLLPDGNRVYPGIGTILQSALAFTWGTRFAYAARAGSAIERERVDDITFLVRYAQIAAERRDEPYKDADPERIIVLGYGSGGAAATLYAATSAPQIAAAIAVEGPILSALKGEDPAAPHASGARSGLFKAWVAEIYARIKFERLLRVSNVPAPTIPVLFLVSDLVREPEFRDGRYATVLRALLLAEAPCLLASINGAGPFDYSSVGDEYPLYLAAKPGLNKRSMERGYYIERTAGLITNFVNKVVPGADGTRPLIRATLGEEIKTETGGSWKSTDVTAILRP